MGNCKNSETGDRLRRIARQMYNESRNNLARALGMKPPSFSKYMQGNRRPGTAVLKRLTRLGVTPHWFLTGEGTVAQLSSYSAEPLPVVREETPSETKAQRTIRPHVLPNAGRRTHGQRLVETAPQSSRAARRPTFDIKTASKNPDDSLHRISPACITEHEEGAPRIEEIGTAD
jgi:transcriptional regulator with XRE-family HTH domain